MKKALEILKHIESLYVEQPDFSKIEKMARNNPERVQAWRDAFNNYNLSDVLNAIDEFWNFKSSKSKPSVHQIRAILVSKKVDTSNNSPSALRSRILKCADEMGDKYAINARERYLKVARQQFPGVDLSNHPYDAPAVAEVDKFSFETDYASKFMLEDIKRGKCRHLLYIYNRAVKYVAEEILSQHIPTCEWAKLDFRERCEKAFRLGMYNDFDEVLILICRQLYNKDFQF